MCVFLMDMAVADFMFENTADLMEGATGLNFTPDEVHQVGERINNLARVFNTLAGFTRADDDLPERLKTEPIPDGAVQGRAHLPGRPRPHARRVLRRPRLDAARACPRGPSSRSCAWATPPTGWAST